MGNKGTRWYWVYIAHQTNLWSSCYIFARFGTKIAFKTRTKAKSYILVVCDSSSEFCYLSQVSFAYVFVSLICINWMQWLIKKNVKTQNRISPLIVGKFFILMNSSIFLKAVEGKRLQNSKDIREHAGGQEMSKSRTNIQYTPTAKKDHKKLLRI